MAKLVLNNVASLTDELSAIQTINENNDKIEAALEKTLSRDGISPNQMAVPLDMNSNRIINLPAPVSSSEPARWIDVASAISIDTAVPALVSGSLLSNDGITLSWVTPGSIVGLGDMRKTENLSGLSSPATARTNLGLGTAATYNIGTSGTVLPTLDSQNYWQAPQIFQAGGVFTGEAPRMLGDVTTLYDDSLGFRGAPANFKEVNYTFTLSDSGRYIRHSSGTAHVYTLPSAGTVNYPLGTTLIVGNLGTGLLTITPAVGVALQFMGSTTASAAKVVAQNGVAILFKSNTNSWLVSGAGVT